MPGVNRTGVEIAWKPLIVCPREEMTAGLRQVLLDLGIATVVQTGYPAPGTIAGTAAQQACNLSIVYVVSTQDHGLRVIAELAGAMPVVAWIPHKDADLILHCMRAGAGEFLSETVAAAVRAVLERLAKARAPGSPRYTGKIYCVIPGKPGCGASTLAIHLALHLRDGGKGKVLLADMDPMTGSLAFMLKLKPEFHLGDVLRDWSRIDADLWSRFVVPSYGLDVLTGPEHPAFRLDVDRKLAGELLAFWREHYQAVVIDTADVRGAEESGFAALADEVLLVTTNEMAALHATRRAVERLDQSLIDSSRLRLIVNRYNSAGGLSRSDLKNALQVAPYAFVSHGYGELESALLEGRPASAGSQFRDSILALAHQLRGDPSPGKKSSPWLGLLHKRR